MADDVLAAREISGGIEGLGDVLEVAGEVGGLREGLIASIILQDGAAEGGDIVNGSVGKPVRA